MVAFGVRCADVSAPEVRKLLVGLHESGEPRSAFHDGTVPLREEFGFDLFPKTLDDCGETYVQNLEIYENGELTSRSVAL